MPKRNNEIKSVVKPKSGKPELRLGKRLVPIMDLVYVERFEIGDTVGKEGLIVMPDAYKGHAMIGRVFAVGPGLPLGKCAKHSGNDPHYQPMSVKVGDYVMFGMWGGRALQFEEGGEILEYVALKEGEILGIVDYDRK